MAEKLTPKGLFSLGERAQEVEPIPEELLKRLTDPQLVAKLEPLRKKYKIPDSASELMAWIWLGTTTAEGRSTFKRGPKGPLNKKQDKKDQKIIRVIRDVAFANGLTFEDVLPRAIHLLELRGRLPVNEDRTTTRKRLLRKHRQEMKRTEPERKLLAAALLGHDFKSK